MKETDENVIPPMTNPLGQYWDQPDPKNIVLDDNYAAMTREDFEKLPDYSQSEPTGKYNGKMWKGKYGNRTSGLSWWLFWCHDEDAISNSIYISNRLILICDE